MSIYSSTTSHLINLFSPLIARRATAHCAAAITNDCTWIRLSSATSPSATTGRCRAKQRAAYPLDAQISHLRFGEQRDIKQQLNFALPEPEYRDYSWRLFGNRP